MAAPTVTEQGKETPDDRAELYLVVVGPGFTSSHPLPAEGVLLVGRAEDADVRILDSRASRSHLRLHVGAVLEVEDLQSANGTRVRDRQLDPGERVTVAPGETIAIGATILVVQQRAPVVPQRRLRAHGYFETMLIEECARAEEMRGAFGLARVHVAPGTPDGAVERAAEGALRPGDVLGEYGPGEFEVLLPDTERQHAEAVMARLTEALGSERISLRTGIAFFPGDGRSPQALFAHASRLVRGAEDRAPVDPEVVVHSPRMRELHALAARAAAGTISILITGETGAGKEVLAEAIHRRSPRADGPFVCLNCAALNRDLLESELFGHEKGAFTGAVQPKPGLLEAAHGGTLFLDEIAEMSFELQAKLLRVLETRKVTRVGATAARAVDVRFVAATNRELDEEVAEKAFRQDLYFRLAGITLAIPPLRQRREEIEPLARLFIEAVSVQLRRPMPSLSREALALLDEYDWPGNIRELRNEMERAVLLCDGSLITPEHLPLEKLQRSAALRRVTEAQEGGSGLDWRARQEEIERAAIVDALARCRGNQTRAAELLGMPRRTFCNRLKEFDIGRSRKT